MIDLVRIVKDLKFLILLLLSIFAFYYAIQAEIYFEIELRCQTFENSKSYKIKTFSSILLS